MSPILITNELNTSQTRIYCYEKTVHPVQAIDENLKNIKGTCVCINPQCIPVLHNKPHQTRDAISSLAIVLTGLHAVISNYSLDPFDPKGISPSYADNTKHDTTNAFCARSVEWLEFDGFEA